MTPPGRPAVRQPSGRALGCDGWLTPRSAPTEASLRRALRRAADGRPLDADEAAVLLAARGDDLDELLAAAGAVRDAGLVDAGRPGVVTYSKKVFIPLTRLCRDRCHYCTFATVPHRLPAAFLERDEVLAIAAGGRRAGLQGGAVHPGRPAGGALAGGPAVARRARLRLHPGLPAGAARSPCSRRPACCRTSTRAC